MSKENNEERKIEVADSIAGGEYANAMQVMHNKEEFHLTFINLSGNSGRTVSKVVSAPGHYKRMLAALMDNLKKYEDAFGPIDDSPALPGGFTARLNK
jgi:hypothetical protein